MQIAMVGLGRMGLNMARRLLRGGHEVVGYNRSFARTGELVRDGGGGAESLEDLVAQVAAPRTVWLMLPEGGPTEEMVAALGDLLAPGDLVVDGGNTFFRDDLRRAEGLAGKGIHYCDAGVSGGIWGLEEGYCLMLGGAEEDFARLHPVLETLAPPEGFLHCGPVGAGHFVKMVHNGIEYAMMEAYGEGMEILRASQFGDGLSLRAVAHLWQRGSVVRSRLLGLLEDALAKDPELASISGYVEDSGEGRWTVQQAVELGVAADGIAHALFKRFLSRETDAFSNRVLAALRNEFGGHATVAAGAATPGASAGAGEVKLATAAPRAQG
jgi:6-phosphogluconate dehydrogenase